MHLTSIMSDVPMKENEFEVINFIFPFQNSFWKSETKNIEGLNSSIFNHESQLMVVRSTKKNFEKFRRTNVTP